MNQSGNSSLSIAQWHDYVAQGVHLPMRIPIHGVSMYPLIRLDRDMVTIVPLTDTPIVGDIVLFADPQIERRYVLHRLWNVSGTAVTTWGDNCDGPDREMNTDCLWGKVVLIERGKRQIIPDPQKGLRHARLWHPVGKALRNVRAKLYKILIPLWKIIKPIVRHKDGRH